MNRIQELVDIISELNNIIDTTTNQEDRERLCTAIDLLNEVICNLERGN